MNHYPALQLVHAGGILTEALLDGCRLPLTQRERSLLNNLAREPGKVLLRDVLMEQHGMTDHELYNQIYRLRRKIRPALRRAGRRPQRLWCGGRFRLPPVRTSGGVG